MRLVNKARGCPSPFVRRKCRGHERPRMIRGSPLNKSSVALHCVPPPGVLSLQCLEEGS